MGMRRIVLLLASMAVTVVFGSGVTLADSPTTKEDCKNGGYAKYGFKNQGQCIKAVSTPPPPPDPGLIYFTTTQFNGQPEIATMNPDGTNVQRADATCTVYPQVQPDVSPVANYFAFTRGDTTGIWLGGTNNSPSGCVKHEPGTPGVADSPSFSPDGLSVAVGRGGAIEVYSLQTGVSQPVLDLDGEDRGPSWGPDNLIVWSNTQQGIFAGRTDGSDIALLDSNGTQPDITNDGSQVVYDTLPDRDLYTINIDGSNKQNITPQGFDGDIDAPQWSPDGTKIVFSTPSADGDIYTVNTDGSNLQNLTNSASGDFYPTWAHSPQ
jgi:hypothetical protein